MDNTPSRCCRRVKVHSVADATKRLARPGPRVIVASPHAQAGSPALITNISLPFGLKGCSYENNPHRKCARIGVGLGDSFIACNTARRCERQERGITGHTWF